MALKRAVTGRSAQHQDARRALQHHEAEN
ncbi:hypothetical protein PSPO01_03046 [Paraphaeosphaeria sporulosa]